MCWCGALDCRRCYPGNFIYLNGRYVYVEAIQEAVDDKVQDLESGSMVCDYEVRDGQLYDLGKKDFIETWLLEADELLSVAEQIL